jgi:hypothetical protein
MKVQGGYLCGQVLYSTFDAVCNYQSFQKSFGTAFAVMGGIRSQVGQGTLNTFDDRRDSGETLHRCGFA